MAEFGMILFFAYFLAFSPPCLYSFEITLKNTGKHIKRENYWHLMVARRRSKKENLFFTQTKND